MHSSNTALKGCFVWICSSALVLLGGCDHATEHQDLKAFIERVSNVERQDIEPLPSSPDYEWFTYSASGLRSPFQAPIKADFIVNNTSGNEIKPDENRTPEFLENFDFDDFTMVGTISDASGFWALLSIDGSVYRVQVGEHLGRNHGRIISITDDEVQVIELVVHGSDTWIERPQTISVKQG